MITIHPLCLAVAYCQNKHSVRITIFPPKKWMLDNMALYPGIVNIFIWTYFTSCAGQDFLNLVVGDVWDTFMNIETCHKFSQQLCFIYFHLPANQYLIFVKKNKTKNALVAIHGWILTEADCKKMFLGYIFVVVVGVAIFSDIIFICWHITFYTSSSRN